MMDLDDLHSDDTNFEYYVDTPPTPQATPTASEPGRPVTRGGFTARTRQPQVETTSKWDQFKIE